MSTRVAAAEVHGALKASGLEYSALSWGGFNIFGDGASIQEVTRLIHVEGRAKALEEMLKHERSS